ncbi:MAG: homoserine O-acetyltransferase [Firmicutes bacterium]|nr:homoserine O-acetyltransferase [Bacillota bacterium]
MTLFKPPHDFLTESGRRLGPITVAYETYGHLNEAGTNAILICHALTGDAHAAGSYTGDDVLPGWWDGLIGPGKAFDTDHYFVVCSNVLGGCQGTTGPSSVNPATGRPYGTDFPIVTIRDMVRVQRELLRHLGVNQLVCVAGGSMGGMQVLEWGVMFPGFMQSIIPIAVSAFSTPQQIAYNYAGRYAIMSDPAWQNGNYYPGPGPVHGLITARAIGTITYKTDATWLTRFGRRLQYGDSDPYQWGTKFAIESYLEYQGHSLIKRFDANSYLYLTRAIDLYDLGRDGTPEGWKNALTRVTASSLVISINSDILYPPYQQEAIAETLAKKGKDVTYYELDSPYGHDAFLIEFAVLDRVIGAFLKRIQRSCEKPMNSEINTASLA